MAERRMSERIKTVLDIDETIQGLDTTMKRMNTTLDDFDTVMRTFTDALKDFDEASNALKTSASGIDGVVDCSNHIMSRGERALAGRFRGARRERGGAPGRFSRGVGGGGWGRGWWRGGFQVVWGAGGTTCPTRRPRRLIPLIPFGG